MNYPKSTIVEKKAYADALMELKTTRTEHHITLPKSIESLILVLRAEDRHLKYEFFTDYARFICHPRTPLLRIAEVKSLYHRWRRTPRIIEQLLSLADTVKTNIQGTELWKEIIERITVYSSADMQLLLNKYLNLYLSNRRLQNNHPTILPALLRNICEAGILKILNLSEAPKRSSFKRICALHERLLSRALEYYESSQDEVSEKELHAYLYKLATLVSFHPYDDDRFDSYLNFLLQHFSPNHVLDFFARKQHESKQRNKETDRVFKVWKAIPEQFGCNSFYSWKQANRSIPIAHFIVSKSVKYVIPDPFLVGVDYLNRLERLWMVECLQGKKIAELTDIPFAISSKAVSVFNSLLASQPVLQQQMAIQEHKIIHVQPISYYLFISELIHSRASIEFVMRIHTARLFNTDITVDTWLIHLRALIRMGYPPSEVNEVIDFIHYAKVFADQDIELSGMTVSSLNRRIHDFHLQQRKNAYLKQFEGKEIIPSDIPNYTVDFGNVRYEIRQILSKNGLMEESEIMKHCVFSYVKHCVNGISFIFSMRSIEADRTEHLLTLEIDRKRSLVQARGLQNRHPTDGEMQIVDLWLKENNLGKAKYF
jgi:hypothetical protein